MTAARLPLEGRRVLDYGQYVAAPLATMLLADLGADVVKVEPPRGDEWRRYDPLADGESRSFYALNRNKRSVSLDLRRAAGRAASEGLIATADALVHNCLPERALRFGLDATSVRAVNPACAVVAVSSFGSDGPLAGRPGYDLIGQALSGLLLADPPAPGRVPRRAGGLAIADVTAGVLAALAAVAGMLAAERGSAAPSTEVSLIGAALLMQVQRFVAVGGAGDRGSDAEALDPYYRVHACADGFVALACLNEPQRRGVCAVVGRADPHAANPQAPPRDAAEHARRRRHAAAVEAAFARMTVHDALAALEARAIPAGALRPLGALFDDPQARANGLVQEIEQPAVGTVSLLGSVFKVDGGAPRARRPAPGLDEHRAELLRDAAQPSAGSTWART